MANTEQVTNVSVNAFPFASVLTIVFIVLKLTGFINWSWWWVLSPIWISILAFIAFLALFLVVAFIVVLFQQRRDRKRAAQRREAARNRRRRQFGIEDRMR